MLLLLLLLWPCLLLLITLYLIVINEWCSEAHGAHVEFVWWGGGWWGLHSHFHVQPNYSVEVVLHCVVVGVVTTLTFVEASLASISRDSVISGICSICCKGGPSDT